MYDLSKTKAPVNDRKIYLGGEEKTKHSDDGHRLGWAFVWTCDGLNNLPIMCGDCRGR